MVFGRAPEVQNVPSFRIPNENTGYERTAILIGRFLMAAVSDVSDVSRQKIAVRSRPSSLSVNPILRPSDAADYAVLDCSTALVFLDRDKSSEQEIR